MSPRDASPGRAVAFAARRSDKHSPSGDRTVDEDEVGEGGTRWRDLHSPLVKRLGPLGSAWFGPHDIAWSPAGYAVVALGEVQGQTFVFKAQAVAPGVALPLWTFLPNTKQGLQLALAVAVGPYGEVYADGSPTLPVPLEEPVEPDPSSPPHASALTTTTPPTERMKLMARASTPGPGHQRHSAGCGRPR